MNMSDYELPEAEKKQMAKLMRTASVEIPTVALFFFAWVVYFSSLYLGVKGLWPAWMSIVTTSVAGFWLFTVVHDATHNAVSSKRWVNEWLGRIAMMGFTTFPPFSAYRYLHMQHHRFTNEGSDKDPDMYITEGSSILLPFRLMTIDYAFYKHYLTVFFKGEKKYGNFGRPVKELYEGAICSIIVLSIVGYAISQGFALEALIFWFIPQRFSLMLLSYAFDYIPHYPYDVKQKDNPFRSTNIRQGFEWILTPALLWQNYHLLHHLYPRVPFYRYSKAWNIVKQPYAKYQPLIVSAFSLKEKVKEPIKSSA